MEALHWYWLGLEWVTQRKQGQECEVTWVEIAIDFYRATGVTPESTRSYSQVDTLWNRTKLFTAATRQMAKILRTEVAPTIKTGERNRNATVRALTQYGYGPMEGIKARPILRDPNGVGDVIEKDGKRGLERKKDSKWTFFMES